MFHPLLAKLKTGLFGDGGSIALPMMDGPLKPNRRLDDAQVLGAPVPGCDDLVARPDGSLLLSAGCQILQLEGPDLAQRSVWRECGGTVGALAVAGSTVYAAIAGQGVVRIDDGRVTATLAAVEGQPLSCVTALVLLPGGQIGVAEGSRINGVADWSRDLLERQARGRIVVASADLSSASTLIGDLAWPNGLAVQGDSLWYSEAWRHRVQAIPLAGGAPRSLVHNLPGYPARLSSDPGGDLWLAVFAVRTQLLEFVLGERAYREEMLATVDPRYWIAPSLGTTGHYLEPLQGGAIKKLGIVKPWAPPRSYGLVVRLSARGELLDSVHSRAGGVHHGITAIQRAGDRMIAVSRGSGRLLAFEPERRA